MNRAELLMPSPRNPPINPNDHWSKKIKFPGFKDDIYDKYSFIMKRGGIPMVAPGNPREQLYEDDMIGLKRGGRAKDKKKKSKKQGMSQVQKVNIKIGDFSKLLEKKRNDDTAMIMKSNGYFQPVPTSHNTYMRLEAPPFKYATPLPSVIPNLYQANPSSISSPLVSSVPQSSKGGDLQPPKGPIGQDTDPNDLQSTSIRQHSSRAIPSEPSVSGSISGIVGSDEYRLSDKRYREYYDPASPYLSGMSTPASQQEQYLASRLLTSKFPGDSFMTTRYLESP